MLTTTELNSQGLTSLQISTHKSVFFLTRHPVDDWILVRTESERRTRRNEIGPGGFERPVVVEMVAIRRWIPASPGPASFGNRNDSQQMQRIVISASSATALRRGWVGWRMAVEPWSKVVVYEQF